MAVKKFNIDLDIQGKLGVTNVPNASGDLLTYNGQTVSRRTYSQIISDLKLAETTWVNTNFIPKSHPTFAVTQAQINNWDTNLNRTYSFAEITNKPTTIAGYGITDAYPKTESDGRFVPYTGATQNVNLNGKYLHNVDTLVIGASGIPQSGSYENGDIVRTTPRSYHNGLLTTTFLDVRSANGANMFYPLSVSGYGNSGSNRGVGIQFNVGHSSGTTPLSSKPLARLGFNPTGPKMFTDYYNGSEWVSSKYFINFATGLINSDAGFSKTGGTATQFLKADGSVDSNTYALGTHNHDDRYYTKTETNTEIKNSIDAIQIGGRNLLSVKNSKNKVFLTSDGQESSNSLWSISDYIKVFPDTIYITDNYLNLGTGPSTCFYDADKVFISGIANGNTNSGINNTKDKDKRRFVVTPANAAYARVSYETADADSITFQKGNKSTTHSLAPEDQISDWSQSDETAFDFIKNKPTADIAKGVQAFNWDNHATQGYLKSADLNGQATQSWVNANFDKYTSWNLKTEGVQRVGMTSGSSLDIRGGTNVTTSYGAGGVVTINSTDTKYTAGSGISISGTTITNSAPNIDQKLSISGMKITLDRSGGTVTVPSSNLVTSTTATGLTNLATTNTNTYLNIVEGGTTLGSSTQVTGTGSVTVSSDTNGKLTINGVNTNTTYTGSSGITLSGTDFRPTYGTTANTVAQGNDTRINNGQTAFEWDNHATQGYLKLADLNGQATQTWVTDNFIPTSHPVNAITGQNITNWNTAFTNNHTHANKSVLDGIASTNVTNWNNAYSYSQVGHIPLAQKGAANGVASLDSNGQVPSEQLPSYVDDVIEAANLAALNALPIIQKMTGKIYVTLDTNRTYRWSGTQFVMIATGEVDSVNGKKGVVTLTTSDINEGTNQYFTTARARASISASTGVTYSSSTGQISVNYGTTAGTAAQGNDSRINNGQTAFGWDNHATQGYLKLANLPNPALVTSTTAAGTTNAATTNTNTFLNIVYNGGSIGSSTQITGAGSVTVSSDTAGKLIITATDTTYSTFTKTVSGLVPAPTGTTSTRFLREDGTWVIPTNTTYSAGTLAILQATTPTTTNYLWSSKNLNDWLTPKLNNYVKKDGDVVTGPISSANPTGTSVKHYKLSAFENVDEAGLYDINNKKIATIGVSKPNIDDYTYGNGAITVSEDNLGGQKTNKFNTVISGNLEVEKSLYANHVKVTGTETTAVETFVDSTQTYAICSAFDYKWADNIWRVGIKRGGGMDSPGFAFNFNGVQEALLEPGGYLSLQGGMNTGEIETHSLYSYGFGYFEGELTTDANIISYGNAYINNTSGGIPTISLAIGDNDTGFNWEIDGSISYYSNSSKLYDLNSVWHSGNLNPSRYATTVWSNSTFIPKSHPVYNVTQAQINNWSNKFKDLKNVANIDLVSESGIYRQEFPSSGYAYTSTLNLSSDDGRQQLSIARDGNEMSFRGSMSLTGTAWSPWKRVWHSGNFDKDDVVTLSTTQEITGRKIFKTTSNPFTTTVRLTGDSATNPTLAFLADGRDWGGLQYNGSYFSFTNSDGTGFKSVKATQFIRNGGTSTQVMMADGSVKEASTIGGTTYTAGTNITISGTTISVSNSPTFSGNVTAPGFFMSSARDLKKNIKPYEESALELIQELDIVSFDYKNGAKNKVGVIAEDTNPIFLSEKRDAVDLYNTVFLQAKAIQELKEEIEELKKVINHAG